MSLGGAVALSLVGYGILANPFQFDYLSTADRFAVVSGAALAPGFFLMLCIGLLARHRMLTPEDIDGAGLTAGTPRAKLMQAVLQNTLEQGLLAVIAWSAWAFLMPPSFLSVVPLAAVAFVVGRILFIRGYKHGPASRALGFTLSFYVSSTMLMGVLVYRLVTY